MTNSTVSFGVDGGGYERWCVRNTADGDVSAAVWHHQLLAIAEGASPRDVFDTGNYVRHENGIPWDNRPDNIEFPAGRPVAESPPPSLSPVNLAREPYRWACPRGHTTLTRCPTNPPERRFVCQTCSNAGKRQHYREAQLVDKKHAEKADPYRTPGESP